MPNEKEIERGRKEEENKKNSDVPKPPIVLVLSKRVVVREENEMPIVSNAKLRGGWGVDGGDGRICNR